MRRSETRGDAGDDDSVSVLKEGVYSFYKFMEHMVAAQLLFTNALLSVHRLRV